MRISFNPPLGETLHATVLSYRSTVQLLFTATFASTSDYDAYNKEGMRLELWSEIGNTQGWAATTFAECQTALIKDGGSNDEASFPLVREDGPGGGEISPGDTNTLSLSLSVPFTGQTRIAYTYRLVRPSGEIQWLGHASNNGVLVVETDLSFGAGWSMRPEPGEAHMWSSPGGPVDGVEVAKLKTRSGYTVWAVGMDGRVSDTPTSSSLIFFVPAGSVALSPAFVLSASPESSISLSPDGEITFTGPEESSLILHAFQPGSDPRAFMDRILSHSGAHCQLLNSHPGSGYIILVASGDTYPGYGLIIPLSSSPVPKARVALLVDDLSGQFPDVSRMSLFSPASRRCKFFDVNPKQSISFTVDSAGGHFIFAPVHLIGKDNQSWEVSIASPYVLAPTIREADSLLPTPPDSPPLRSIANLPDMTSPATPAGSGEGGTVPSAPPDTVVRKLRYLSEKIVGWVRTGYSLSLMLMMQGLLHFMLGSLFSRRADSPSELGRSQRTGGLPGIRRKEEIASPPVTSPEASIDKPIPSQPKSETIPASSELLVIMQSSAIFLLLRPCDGKAPVDEIEVKVDGLKVNQQAEEVQDDILCVESKCTSGGRLKVSVQ